MKTLPKLSTATHSDSDGHETSRSECASTFVAVHFVAPPVGSVEVTTSPALSTATQSEAVAHETP